MHTRLWALLLGAGALGIASGLLLGVSMTPALGRCESALAASGDDPAIAALCQDEARMRAHTLELTLIGVLGVSTATAGFCFELLQLRPQPGAPQPLWEPDR